MANDSELVTFRIPVDLAEAMREASRYYGRTLAAELRTAVGIYLRVHAVHMAKSAEPSSVAELEESLGQFVAHAWRRPAVPTFPPSSVN